MIRALAIGIGGGLAVYAFSQPIILQMLLLSISSLWRS